MGRKGRPTKELLSLPLLSVEPGDILANGKQKESEPHRGLKCSHNQGDQAELKNEGRILCPRLRFL